MKKNRMQYSVTNRILKFLFVIISGCGLFFIPSFTQGQDIDLLLKGGRVIDPKNKIDAKMDVAIAGGKIYKVAANIPANTAKKVVDVTGLYVTPGLIDPHTHVFVGSSVGKFAGGTSSVTPDDFTLRAGVTTVVDAGTAGWRNFEEFKKSVIDLSKTRVLSFLNAFGTGMVGSPGEEDVNDMDLKMKADIVKKYPDIIVGIKLGHYRGGQWSVFEKAEEDARSLNIPLFIECHLSNLSLEGQLSRMRPGDIMTHCFERVNERTPFVDASGKVLPYVLDARKRGIFFDLGHGGGGFWFSQAIPAVKQGFYPDSFGSDLHHNSVNAGMKDMLTSMSKFLNMGMPLQEIINRGSWIPAKSIKREDLGNLSVGAVADVAVLRLKEGKFGFVDAGGGKMDGTRKLEAEMTIRGGNVVWDLNGMSAIAWEKQPVPQPGAARRPQ
jgi:dihydroorotase